MVAAATLIVAGVTTVSPLILTAVRRGVCLAARTVERGGASLSAIPNPFSYNTNLEVAA